MSGKSFNVSSSVITIFIALPLSLSLRWTVSRENIKILAFYSALFSASSLSSLLLNFTVELFVLQRAMCQLNDVQTVCVCVSSTMWRREKIYIPDSHTFDLLHIYLFMCICSHVRDCFVILFFALAWHVNDFWNSIRKMEAKFVSAHNGASDEGEKGSHELVISPSTVRHNNENKCMNESYWQGIGNSGNNWNLQLFNKFYDCLKS